MSKQNNKQTNKQINKQISEPANDRTELVFILDRSGSMCGREADTIGGFNAMMQKQKQQPGGVLVSTVLFDDTCRVLHDRLPLAQVPAMTEQDYFVGGCTALLDAVGGAIKHIGTVHRYARPEDVPAHTLFVITTDGMENASHRYTLEQVRKMIEQRKEQGWEFLFLGANIDAIETAGQMGIHPTRAVNYCCDGQGIEACYGSVSTAVSAMRCAAPLDASWKSEVEADTQSRKGKKGLFHHGKA